MDASGRVSGFDLPAATLALGGIGVWTMHCIGMTALRLDLRVGYAMTETLPSLLVVCLTTAFGLLHVARAPTNRSRLANAGVIVGLGVGVMHCLGMHGMRFGGQINGALLLVATSLVIVVVAATAALWLALNTRPWPWPILSAPRPARPPCPGNST